MDLTRQPPRRASNLSLAGIVGAARMTDKARAHNNGTMGEYLYGGNSGLDAKVLELLEFPTMTLPKPLVNMTTKPCKHGCLRIRASRSQKLMRLMRGIEP